MSPSPNLIEFLRGWEGPPSLHVRADPASPGTFDIGYGHVCSQAHEAIDDAECDRLLRTDVNRFAALVDALVTVPLAQHEFDALVSFAFNLGIKNLRDSTLLKRLNAEQYDLAVGEFHKWVKADGKALTGLIKRRAAEQDMWSLGDYSRRP